MEQSHVLQLAHEPLPIVRIGFIGLGNRGMATLRRYLAIEHIDIVALCDISSTHLAEANALLSQDGRYQPQIYDTANDGAPYANEKTLTSYTSVPTGSLTHSWLAMPWNRTSM